MKAFKCDCCGRFCEAGPRYSVKINKHEPYPMVDFSGEKDFCAECGDALESFLKLRQSQCNLPI